MMKGLLTLFTQISGRVFLPDLCGEVHPAIAPLQALCCASCSADQSTFRGGERREKVPRKEEKEGWPAAGKKEKRMRENRSICRSCYATIPEAMVFVGPEDDRMCRLSEHSGCYGLFIFLMRRADGQFV